MNEIDLGISTQKLEEKHTQRIIMQIESAREHCIEKQIKTYILMKIKYKKKLFKKRRKNQIILNTNKKNQMSHVFYFQLFSPTIVDFIRLLSLVSLDFLSTSE